MEPKFIQLTDENNNPLFININSIIYLEPHHKFDSEVNTLVVLKGQNELEVLDFYEHIKTKITELINQ